MGAYLGERIAREDLSLLSIDELLTKISRTDLMLAGEELALRAKADPQLAQDEIVPSLIALKDRNSHIVTDALYTIGHHLPALVPTVFEAVGRRLSPYLRGTLFDNFVLSQGDLLTPQERRLLDITKTDANFATLHQHKASRFQSYDPLQGMSRKAIRDSFASAVTKTAPLFHDRCVRGSVKTLAEHAVAKSGRLRRTNIDYELRLHLTP